MKLPRFLPRANRKLLAVRRVVGTSMMPSLLPGQVVVATGLVPIRQNSIVIAYVAEREVIKRVAAVHSDSVELLGDNPEASTDSRSYGAVAKTALCARVIFTTKKARDA